MYSSSRNLIIPLSGRLSQQFSRYSNYKMITLGRTHIMGFCSNVATSDHAHILHTGVFESEEFNKKGFMHGSITVPEIFAVEITKFP